MRITQLIRGSLLILAGVTSARADVKLPAVLSDHMVLQQGMPVPVWGTADAGEEVTVAFGNQKQTAKADEKGHWQVALAPLQTSNKPQMLTAAGKNKIELKDILVGEVWICSGQSNMSFTLNSAGNWVKEVAAANYPEIRLFSVPRTIATEPQADVKGNWAACVPDVASHFTAVGYFFGRDLYKDLHIPIGLIHTSWGGTPAESWTPNAYLEQDPDLKKSIDRFEAAAKNYPTVKAAFDKDEAKLMKAWEAKVAKAKAENQTPPRKPLPPRVPSENPMRPSVLYNGMISPIVPFAARGVIWYQGEANAGRAFQYRKLLPTMIKSWRDVWHEPEMNFYIVSLANYMDPPKEPGDSDWAELREAQAMTAAQPHNGQALAIDLADPTYPRGIHPKNKQDVGLRLELVALAKSYGKNVVYSGPEYKDSKIEGNKVVLHFNFADGMAVKGGELLKGFQIAGADKKWFWADAKIDGEAVVVSSKDVEKPAAARYDWANNPEGNLYGKTGLPAAPFRTDDWLGITVGKN